MRTSNVNEFSPSPVPSSQERSSGSPTDGQTTAKSAEDHGLEDGFREGLSLSKKFRTKTGTVSLRRKQRTRKPLLRTESAWAKYAAEQRPPVPEMFDRSSGAKPEPPEFSNPLSRTKSLRTKVGQAKKAEREAGPDSPPPVGGFGK